ncbi:UDP-2,3-diacylglucosamine diphosphatase [Rubrivirga sp. IMCC45206]|uniref:UDP-2,3-diacylglucosamine diphosphatase n=1 Tax=Rubrivirga sp. IMCC45206 TaxID=3391614 RepID=UPI00399021E6
MLLGDVYDQFIEYKHLVPKAAPRLVGLLAEWADAGARVVYVVGNRDHWHLDYFQADIGVTVVPAWQARLGERALYIAHGDGQGRPHSLADRLSHRLQPLLRAPLMARLYRMGLPGDTGYALARAVARRFGTDGAPDAPTAAALADAARHRLADGADVVAFGHSHATALDAGPAGLYLNPGYWFGARTFATLDADAARLARWRDGAAETLATESLAPRTAAPALS